ncbi:hypothetical protein ABTN45_19335, partial [Acinetobacter baumannii]
MLKAYRSGDFAAALRTLGRLKLREIAGIDLSVTWAIYVQRLREFETEPPQAEWDGSSTMTEK